MTSQCAIVASSRCRIRISLAKLANGPNTLGHKQTVRLGYLAPMTGVFHHVYEGFGSLDWAGSCDIRMRFANAGTHTNRITKSNADSDTNCITDPNHFNDESQ